MYIEHHCKIAQFLMDVPINFNGVSMPITEGEVDISL